MLLFHLSPKRNESSIVREGLIATNEKGHASKPAVYLVLEHEFGLDVAFELLREEEIVVFQVSVRKRDLRIDPECSFAELESVSFMVYRNINSENVKVVGCYKSNGREKSFSYVEKGE